MNTHLINFQSMFSENLVEFVDILPTLVEAAGLPELEKCPVDSRNIKICREGTSLLKIPEGQYNVIICLSEQHPKSNPNLDMGVDFWLCKSS